MPEALKIINYPDPRLRKISAQTTVFDASLAEMVQRMLELMREAKGVGLAAAQVGRNVRLFVINPTGKPEDDRAYINPRLLDAEGEEIAEEGCLSLPGIHVDISRARSARIVAQDLTGKTFEQVESGYTARIWQHELDHLNGVMLIDRMGPTALMEHRKTLKELEEKYAQERPAPQPSATSRRRGK